MTPNDASPPWLEPTLNEGKRVMTMPSAVLIRPNVLKMLGGIALANLLMAGGLFLLFGFHTVLYATCAAVLGVSVLLVVIGLARQRPRIRISAEGFESLAVFGSQFYGWADVEGEFAVLKMSMSKAVVFHLTTSCKTQLGKKPTRLLSGYDAALVGHFEVSIDKLAEMLNQYKQQHQPERETREEPASPVQEHPIAAAKTAAEQPSHNNGSRLTRIGAGLASVLFLGAAVSGLAGGNLKPDVIILIFPLALMFGWYAALGKKGMPSFLK
jgi:hypothetical protein